MFTARSALPESLGVGDSNEYELGPAAGLLNSAAGAGRLRLEPSAADRIRVERGAVKRWIDDGGLAYGFTGLLGHLADDAYDPAVALGASTRGMVEQDLLRAHLVASSRLVRLSTIATRCIIGAKLLQLTRGGSGVSEATFQAFLSAWDALEHVELPLDASYSCGDVVPAAWLLHQVDDIFCTNGLQRGDVIAAINGSHVSTGIGVLALGLATTSSRWMLAWIDQYRSVAADPQRFQVPVSLRADSRLFTLLRDALGGLETDLDARLSRSAANPLFESTSEGQLHVASTSAFLDYHMPARLNALRDSLLIGVQHIVALHIELERTHGSKESLTLQYPKVLRALQSRLLQRFGGNSAHLHPIDGASAGLEDAADHSLHLGLDVCELASEMDGVLQVGAEHVAALRLTSQGGQEFGRRQAEIGPALERETLEAVWHDGLFGGRG